MAPADVAAGFFEAGTRLVVVTHGGNGAVAMTPRVTVEVPSREVRVVDTVGAGDSFMGALVAVAIEHGLDGLDEERLTAYLFAAHQVGQITVSRRGADPPWRQELPEGWPRVPSVR
jgi:fructokinase